jgi:metal-sulfur cluster biosynthetic enzyme
VSELPVLARQMEEFGVVLWALFFLIPVGRAEAGQALSAAEIERVLEWAADLAPQVPFGIKTTEAPHYHRVLAQRRGSPASHGPAGSLDGVARRARPDFIGRAGRAVTDGNGFVFIDHLGAICPSGFLPMAIDNVRRSDLVAVYRDAPLFRALRDPSRLGGRCGRCEFRDRCGGSRARAYAVAGDALAEDPGCAWEPAGRPATVPVPLIAGGADVALPVASEQVSDALRTVFDPELGLSIVDLGLVYGIGIDGGTVTITMTLTARGCPIQDLMPQWVRAAVEKVPGVERVEVSLTFDPPWTPARIRT